MPDNYVDPGKVGADQNKKKEAAIQQNIQQNLQNRLDQYGNPNAPKGFTLSGTNEEVGQAISGLELANVGYGQNLYQTGEDIQRIKGLQRSRTEGTDPISEAIRNQKAGAVANAQRRAAAGGLAGGAMEGAIQDLERKSNMDVAASLYGQQAQNIAAERSLASNMLSGTNALMQGSRAEGTAANMPTAPQAGGMFGTVICTELYKQGYYTNEIYMHDIAYGVWIRHYKPEVYIGYRLWADYVVAGMQKSNLFTKLVAMIAVPWAKNMAGEYNLVGQITSLVGESICGVLGKLSTKLGAKYV